MAAAFRWLLGAYVLSVFALGPRAYNSTGTSFCEELPVLARLFLLLILLPVLEIVVLVWLATKTSALFVIALVLGMGVLGTALARHQSAQTLRRISDQVSAGQMPADSLLDGLLVFVAAVLLILPGVLSDVLAILLLFPPSRRFLKSVVRRQFAARVVSVHYGADPAGFQRDRIIDVKVLDSPSPERVR